VGLMYLAISPSSQPPPAALRVPLTARRCAGGEDAVHGGAVDVPPSGSTRILGHTRCLGPEAVVGSKDRRFLHDTLGRDH
jgi:hypothetical protein